MKKILLFSATSLLLLGACGSQEEEPAANEDQSAVTNEVENQEEEVTEQETEPAEPVEEEEEAAVPEEGNLDYDDAAELMEGMAHPIKYYAPDDESLLTEEGLVTLDFEGFKLDFSVFLVDFKPSEEYLYNFDEKETVRALFIPTYTENTNDFDVDYNGGMTITTDTKEQVSAESGLMSDNPIVQQYYGQVASEGYYIVPLEDDSEPTELTVITSGPYQVEDGSVDTSNGPMGGEKRVKLYLGE